MSILYSPAGDTDPIRGMHDGAMLHIIRHYRPRMVKIFLSKDMVEKEERRQVYSKAIQKVAPECAIEFIKTDITEAYKMEKMVALADGFIELRKKYPKEEIILNLSSGTPQMKTIMSFLATDFDNVVAVQVASFAKGSNRENAATKDDEDIDCIIENNFDDEENAENRCHVPPLSLFTRYSVRHQLIGLVNSYEYSAALALYKRHKNMFEEETGRLLEHADLRSKLQLEKAFARAKKKISLKKEVTNLNEFLMVMELRQRKGDLAEFIVKLTPFLYQLALFYLENKTIYKPSLYCERSSSLKPWRINTAKLNDKFPDILQALNQEYKRYGGFRDNTELAFSNMLVILKNLPKVDSQILNVLQDLRSVEKTHRNTVAHTITDITEELLKNTEPYYSSREIVQKLRKVFLLIMTGENVYRNNVYDDLNQEIIKSMDTFSDKLRR